MLRIDPDHFKARKAIQVSRIILCCRHYSLTLSLSQRSKQLLAKKEAGNEAFKRASYQEAYELYTEALSIDPQNITTNAKLYCNRALMASKVRVVGVSMKETMVVPNSYGR